VKVIVRSKNNYGQVQYYPENEEAKVFARISGKTTLTNGVINDLKSIGIEVEILPPVGWDKVEV
jgi:hypothetical protein